MRSLRRAIRRAVLAVPVATTACMGTGSSSTGGTVASTSGSGTSGTSGGGSLGTNLCAGCAAQGLICNPFGTACVNPITAGATSGSGGGDGSTSAECPSFGLCSPLCSCVSTTTRVPALTPTLDANGEVGYCHCVSACGVFPDAGDGAPLSDGGQAFGLLTGCGATRVDLSADAGPLRDGGGSTTDAGPVRDAGPMVDAGPLWDVTCYYYTACTGGRRPAHLIEPRPRAPSAVGAYFAQLAHLEAASVAAFRRLARQLVTLGAPAELVTDARQAARDEVRHARLTRRLANRFGGEVAPIKLGPESEVTLRELALENAREGCVGETFGAAVASWQAEHALDPEVRAVAVALRDDELRHAELAWAIDAWAQERLPPEVRAAIRREKRDAVHRLESAETSVDDPLHRGAGVPAGTEHQALLAALRREVWSEIAASPDLT